MGQFKRLYVKLCNTKMKGVPIMINDYISRLLDKLADKLLQIVINKLILELDNYTTLKTDEQSVISDIENQSAVSVSLDSNASSQEYQHTTAKGFELNESDCCPKSHPIQPNSVCKK